MERVWQKALPGGVTLAEVGNWALEQGWDFLSARVLEVQNDITEQQISLLDDEVTRLSGNGNPREAYGLALLNHAGAVQVARIEWVVYSAQRLEQCAFPLMGDPKILEEHCNAILTTIPRVQVDLREEHARLLIALGNAFIETLQCGKTGAMQQALSCFKEAVETVPSGSLVWVAAKNGLGRAFLQEASGHSQEGLRRAREAFEEALRACPKERDSGWHAALLHNRGIVFRMQGDRSSLQRALGELQEALTLRPREVVPLEHAETLAELGNVFFLLSGATLEEMTGNFRQAEQAYREAAQLFQESRPDLSTRCIRSISHLYRVMPGDREAYLQRAAALLEIELSRVPKGTPAYADFQHALGNLFQDLALLEAIPPEEKEEWRSRAETAYQLALEIWTPDNHPGEHSKLQHHRNKLWRETTDSVHDKLAYRDAFVLVGEEREVECKVRFWLN